MSEVGFLNINKPRYLTSHDVVAQVRRHYRALTDSKKVGHAGTLDPLADGVLVICLGAATRLSAYMMATCKIYRAQITLGATTATYDAASDFVTRKDTAHITLADLQRALPQFIGDIEQIPPMYSAIKVQGRKLYELARAGKSIARQPRKVAIRAIDVLSWDNPVVGIELRCGPGTYVRSLAHDLGEALGVGAYLSALTRIKSGRFKLANSIPLEAVRRDDNWLQHIISPYDALDEYKRLTLDEAEISRVRHGGFIDRRDNIDALVAFGFDAEKKLVAILKRRDHRWKPHKVFFT